MALMWDAVATKQANLLSIGVKNLPDKLERATWLNYIRCHDDIGLGFSDTDIQLAGYDPLAHRRFLVDYFTGNYDMSPARGKPFGQNEKNGDARISGSLASLVGLETALEEGNPDSIEAAIARILLLHSLILAFGGIPLLYYGDAVGTLNSYDYLEDEQRRGDSRWLHRPVIDWRKAELRSQPGTVEYRIFSALKKMIALRKEIPAFADFNNRVLTEVDNPHLFCFLRYHPQNSQAKVMMLANFDDAPQGVGLDILHAAGFAHDDSIKDLCSGKRPELSEDQLIVPSLGFYWLAE